MSLEDELAELSLVYHGQRERCQELEQLVKDYRDFVKRLDPRFGFGSSRVVIRESLLRRTDDLLKSGQDKS